MQPIKGVRIYEEPEAFAEISIRGKFLKMSCDLETTLIRIMTLVTPDPLNQTRNFKGLTMGNKIEALIADLKKYKNKYYLEYENELNKLWDFKAIRDDMAHHKMKFDDVQLKSFKVFLIDVQDGKEQLHQKQYTIDFCKRENNRIYKS